MTSLNSHRPCTEVASTLFGSVQLSTPLLVDLERQDSGGHKLVTDLLQAAKSVGNCSLVSNGRGSSAPSNVTDVQDDRRVLKCTYFRKYSLSSFEEQGEIVPSQKEGTGSNPLTVSLCPLGTRKMLVGPPIVLAYH